MTSEDRPALSEAETEAILRDLVTTFCNLPLENGRTMRELIERDRNTFRTASLAVFRDLPRERGSRYLVTLLWVHELLLPILADPETPRQLCLDLAQTAAKIDPLLHTRLSTYLEEGILENPDLPAEIATRFLEVLSTTTDAIGIAPLLRRILLHPNARIRSKATVLIGRGQSGIRIIERILPDDDPRVRANAIEALWHNPESRAVSLFTGALEDGNNRVVGNAIIGLYFAGSTKAIPAAIALASHPNARFRATAAWAMSKTEDPRFIPYLGKLLCESNGQLRKAVFHALEVLKRSAAARSRSRFVARAFGGFGDGVAVRTQIGVREIETGLPMTIQPTGFAVVLGTSAVMDYTVEVETSSRISAGVVLPRPMDSHHALTQEFIGAVNRLIDSKPMVDQWRILQYSPASTQKTLARFSFLGQEASQHVETSKRNGNGGSSFSSDSIFLAGELQTGKLRYETHPSVFEAIFALVHSPFPRLGTRHIIAFADEDSAVDADLQDINLDDIIGKARAAGIAIHVFSLTPNASLRRMCVETSGFFKVVSDVGTLNEETELFYKSLAHRYVVECPGIGAEALIDGWLTVQVHDARGIADCKMPLAEIAQLASASADSSPLLESAGVDV